MDLSTLLSTIAFVLALASVLISWLALATCKKNAVRELSKRWRAEIETTVTDLTDAVASYEKSLKKLRARIGMRSTREKRANGTDPDIPDPAVDPVGYKRAMRLKLRLEGKL